MAYTALDEHDRALAFFQRAQQKKPDVPHLLANMGNTLSTLARTGEAIHCYDRALALDPQLVRAWSDRGLALATLGRTHDALASFDRALALAPDDVATWKNRASTLLNLKRHADALDAYENVVRLAPGTDYLHGYLLHARMHLCRWDGWSQRVDDTVALVRSGARAAPPFALMAAPVTPATLLACARIYAQDHCPPRADVHRFAPAQAGKKLRIGYFSSDFRNHPTAQLMARLFECHDRSRFECFGFSFGPPAQDEMKERVHAALDHFTHVADRSDADIAALARARGIDIAVDLNGFTEGARPRIFSHRAAGAGQQRRRRRGAGGASAGARRGAGAHRVGRAHAAGRSPGAARARGPWPGHLPLQRPHHLQRRAVGGLPVLTLEGQAFASRVCASLLRAVGLPELVASTEAQYEEAALAIAVSPHQLAGIRSRLGANRTAMPLFDTPRFARNIETTFEAMCERHRQGCRPITSTSLRTWALRSKLPDRDVGVREQS